MNQTSLLRELRKRFQKGRYDPLKCSLGNIKSCFDKHKVGLRLGRITLVVFGTLYRRAACEIITERWKETRADERAAAEGAVVAPPFTTTTTQGLLLLCFNFLILLILSLSHITLLQIHPPSPPRCQAFY